MTDIWNINQRSNGFETWQVDSTGKEIEGTRTRIKYESREEQMRVTGSDGSSATNIPPKAE